MAVRPKKVLIIDDSALVRSMLTEIIDADPRLTVIGVAADPYEARERIKQLHPDVLTLDVEMPRMDGLTFLRNLMRLRPMPVVMISTLTQQGAKTTFDAMALGAVDFLGKPGSGESAELKQYSQLICDKVAAAADANIQAAVEPVTAQAATVPRGQVLRHHFVVGIGASTGGTEAIKQVLLALPAESPPIVLAQHIPAGFSTSYAKRLNDHCAINVYEAQDGQPVRPGCAYLAPGSHHLRIRRGGMGYVCALGEDAPVNRHRPSVDVLFDSLVAAAGDNSLALLLTGMGADGAQGLLRLREAGATTVAQDQATSVVWGMPGAAVKLQAAQQVLPLQKMAALIMQQAYSKPGRRPGAGSGRQVS